MQGPLPPEGQRFQRVGRELVISKGIIRDLAVADADADQMQTRDAFAYKWSKEETYRSAQMQSIAASWLNERYGDLTGRVDVPPGEKPLVLDAGCGAGHSASFIFHEKMNGIRYVGVDISEAVDLARERLSEKLAEQLFLQADLLNLPFRNHSFDVVLSEGVLHHTPSTQRAIAATARLVRPGGIYAIYVYSKKSPVREFTDDFIRAQISDLTPQEAWEKLLPLTRLGKALGDLNIELEVPEPVEVLGIPKGRIDIQRLFYWHVCKLFYRAELSLDEMNHINFDWFMPKYSHRQTPEEVRSWCEDAGLTIEMLKPEQAGITVIGRRPLAAA